MEIIMVENLADRFYKKAGKTRNFKWIEECICSLKYQIQPSDLKNTPNAISEHDREELLFFEVKEKAEAPAKSFTLKQTLSGSSSTQRRET